MASDEVTLDLKTLKAIGAESRIGILKALGERQKTQSELASELKLSKSAVLEHLEKLVSAGLIERIDEGRKWKYYKLTNEGKKLVERRPLNVIIVLAISLILSLSSLLVLWQQFSLLSAVESQLPTAEVANYKAEDSSQPLIMQAQATAATGKDLDKDAAKSLELSSSEDQKASHRVPTLSALLPSFVILVFSLVVAGICIGYLYKD